MAVLAAHPSPTSFQLRWALNCRKPSPASLRIRFPAPDARRRLALLVAAGSPPGGEFVGPASRESSAGSSDPFSGWSGEEAEGGAPQKGRFGGIMGAGLAGIFLAAGITFAALSLGQKNAGTKRQMEPMKMEQEALLVSDEQNVKIDPVENESSSTLSEEGPTYGLDSNTEDPGSAGIDVDAFNTTSTEEDLSSSNIIDHLSEPTSSNVTSTEKPAYAGQLSSDDFSIKDSNINLASGTTDSSVELNDNLETGSLVGLSSSSCNSTNLGIDHHDGQLFSDESENSKLPLDSVGSGGELLIDTSIFEGSDILEMNATLNSQFVSDDAVEQVNSHSGEQDSGPFPDESIAFPSVVHNTNADVPSGINSESNFNLSEMLEVPCEATCPTLEVKKLDVEGYFEAPSSLPVGPLENQPDTSATYESNRGKPLFESALPQKSFSSAGIPAPSLVSAAPQVSPGRILVPAVVDQVQGQALAALQVLKVIEADIQPGDICSRREYARWLVSASSILSRSTTSKVYPAMYIENVTELAFDDVTPEDPDFPFIQGLAEAGLISSKLSKSDMNVPVGVEEDPVFFYPESPVSRQDLVSWKMALEKRQLPEVDRKILYQCSGYIDIDKINPEAWPALTVDLSTREHGIIPLAFGYTRLFQPDKPVTKAQAAIALATGDADEVVGEELARIEAESMADAAVVAHTALVAQVEKDLNARFEQELTMERQKIDAVEKLAEEARSELEKLKREREEENNALIRGHAAVESEMEILSKLRNEVEEQLQSLMSNKVEIAFERERINKLRKEAEKENEVIVHLQYELEVERKALSMARAWAEKEAKRASEQAKALEEARERWERDGLKVNVDQDLRDEELGGTTWLNAGKRSLIEETIDRGENLLGKLKSMSISIKGKSAAVIEKIIQIIMSVVLALKRQASEAFQHASELRMAIIAKASTSIDEFRENASEFGLSIADKSSKSTQELLENATLLCSTMRDGAKRAVEDCREGMEKITQRFKTT
uniref:Huntingtin-interacting protein 1 n=1 Tax=Anthurium amnicola TaxID=1678845 RepID=A0A1D1XEY1_9ARAE